MSDDFLKSKRPKAIYEPGELEKTRRNLGMLDAAEAQELMKKLGGEIGVEKSPAFDESKLPSRTRTYVSRRSSSSSSGSSSGSGGSSSYGSSASTAESRISAYEAALAKKKETARDNLPPLSSKIRQAMDEILIMHRIKPKVGFFAQLFNRAFNRGDKVTEDFMTDQLAIHMRNLHTFHDSVSKLANRANEDYKQKIKQDKSVYFQTIKIITEWDERPILTAYQPLKNNTADVTLQKLIPIVRELYSFLYRLYFLGNRVSQYIKRLEIEVANQNGVPENEQLQSWERNATSSWIYLYEHCLKSMYPILMRMCCSDLVLYPDMMKSESSSILAFIGITKYEVLFPDKEEDNVTEATVEEKKESEKDAELHAREKKYRDQIIQGINALDVMFPGAGWREIQKMPDMFAYYHGLYKFKEGLNFLSPNNPLLITMILLRITEDFISGCRNMQFQPDTELKGILEGQNLQEFMDSWAEYREVLFERNYVSLIRDYVNNMYANLEYARTQFGKKNMSNLQWYAHNQFLPLLKFELKFLDKQEADHILPPLFRQVSMLREFYTEIIDRAENALQTEGEEAYNDDSFGVLNLWSPYSFSLSTPVSKRLDVLLGGKQSKQANNLNLLKYTSSALAVLDWWINNKASPAYTVADPEDVYRHDDEGVPIFSVKPMENVNELFAENIKRMAKK